MIRQIPKQCKNYREGICKINGEVCTLTWQGIICVDFNEHNNGTTTEK